MSKDENAVQQIMTAMIVAMFDALPIRVQSGMVKVRGAWMHLAPPGTPDKLFLLHGGHSLWLESKTLIGKLSEIQRLCHAEYRERGHTVIVASSPEALQAAIAGDTALAGLLGQRAQPGGHWSDD